MKQDLTTQSVTQLLKLMAINCLEKIEIVMGGGVAIYVKNTVNAILRADLTFDNLEAVSIRRNSETEY